MRILQNSELLQVSGGGSSGGSGSGGPCSGGAFGSAASQEANAMGSSAFQDGLASGDPDAAVAGFLGGAAMGALVGLADQTMNCLNSLSSAQQAPAPTTVMAPAAAD